MNNKKINKYVGARYVPLVMGEWDGTKEYEPLMIVTHDGASYTSRTFVPIGTDISDTNFWLCTGNYNAQVEKYRQEVFGFKNSVYGDIESLNSKNTECFNNLEALKNNIDFLRNKTILILGDSMSDETTNAPNWVTKFKELTYNINCRIDNKSVNGLSLSSYSETTIGLADKLNSFLSAKNDYDYIIFHIGTNDCTGQVPLGEWFDSTAIKSFYGAINTVYKTLLNIDNRSKIFWVIPPHTNFGHEKYPRPLHLNAYRGVIVKACNRYKWNIIDAYTHAPFLNPYNATSKERWISDGIHPNASYAPYFTDFVINQLRVGGSTTIGDIPTVHRFTNNIANTNIIIEIRYHSNATYDIRCAIVLLEEWSGGWMLPKGTLPTCLKTRFNQYVFTNDKNCSFAISDGGIWFGVSDGTGIKNISFNICGLEMLNLEPDYQFSY